MATLSISNESNEHRIVTPIDRKCYVIKLIDEMYSAFDSTTTISDTLDYNLRLHAERIENDVFNNMVSEHEYFPRMENLINDVHKNVTQKIQSAKDLMRSSNIPPGQRATNAVEWRQFYSIPLRRAVINGILKDIEAKLKITPRMKRGLISGVEAIEDMAYEDAETKREYFETIEIKKMGMIRDLIRYLGAEPITE